MYVISQLIVILIYVVIFILEALPQDTRITLWTESSQIRHSVYAVSAPIALLLEPIMHHGSPTAHLPRVNKFEIDSTCE